MAYAVLLAFANSPGRLGAGQSEGIEMMYTNNRKLQNAMALAGSLVVLFSLMYASSVVYSSAPLGL